jgi:translation initiation factor eIF-2B subunit gamma
LIKKEDGLSSVLESLNLTDGQSPLDGCDSRDQSMRIGISVHRSSEGQVSRANNLASYMDLNRRVIKIFIVHTMTFLIIMQLLAPTDRRNLGEGVDAKASISPESLIGGSTRIGERTTVKKSAIGRHCVIGKSVKIVGSVIGDHCVVADG